MIATTLVIAAAPLDPAFTGSPQAFFDALVRRMRIVSPEGWYSVVISDTEPTSNLGLWLRDGTKPYVWSDSDRGYVPADLSDSLTSALAAITQVTGQLAAGRVIFSATEPAAADRPNVVWVPLDVVTSRPIPTPRVFDATRAGWVSVPVAIAWTTTGTSPAYAVATGDARTLADLLNLPVAIRTHAANNAEATLSVNASEAVRVVAADGTDIPANTFVAGGFALVVYTGTVFHLLAVSMPARAINPLGVQPARVLGEYKYEAPDDPGPISGLGVNFDVTIVLPAGRKWEDFLVEQFFSIIGTSKHRVNLQWNTAPLAGSVVDSTSLIASSFGQSWRIKNPSPGVSVARASGKVPDALRSAPSLGIRVTLSVDSEGDGDPLVASSYTLASITHFDA